MSRKFLFIPVLTLLSLWACEPTDEDLEEIKNVKVDFDLVFDKDTTLRNLVEGEEIDYTFLGNVSVEAGATLTIEPGVKIAFGEGKHFWVHREGSIKAVGMANKHIVLTSFENKVAYWKGLAIWTKSSKNKLSYVDVENAGNVAQEYGIPKAAIGLGYDAMLHMDHVHIANSGGNGLFVDVGCSLLSFSANDIEGCAASPISIAINNVHMMDSETSIHDNTYNAVEVRTSDLGLSNEVEWSALKDKVPYYISGLLKVRSGVRVKAGAQFEYGEDVAMWVDHEGYFSAIGTAENPIVFKGKEDKVGYWNGIGFWTKSTINELTHVEIMNGGNVELEYGIGKTNIGTAHDGILKLNNVKSASSGGYGIYEEVVGSITASNVTYADNTMGDFYSPVVK